MIEKTSPRLALVRAGDTFRSIFAQDVFLQGTVLGGEARGSAFVIALAAAWLSFLAFTVTAPA